MAPDTEPYPDLVVVKRAQAKESKPEPGLTRRVMAYNDKLFLAEHQMARGWSGTVHSHPHDQIVYVVLGHLMVTCQGKTFDARTGDTFVVRGGIEHGAAALEDSPGYRCFYTLPRGLHHVISLSQRRG